MLKYSTVETLLCSALLAVLTAKRFCIQICKTLVGLYAARIVCVSCYVSVGQREKEGDRTEREEELQCNWLNGVTLYCCCCNI